MEGVWRINMSAQEKAHLGVTFVVLVICFIRYNTALTKLTAEIWGQWNHNNDVWWIKKHKQWDNERNRKTTFIYLSLSSFPNQLMSWWTWWIFPLVQFILKQKNPSKPKHVTCKPCDNVHGTRTLTQEEGPDGGLLAKYNILLCTSPGPTLIQLLATTKFVHPHPTMQSTPGYALTCTLHLVVG